MWATNTQTSYRPPPSNPSPYSSTPIIETTPVNNDDILGEDDIQVDLHILPGITVTSGYRNEEINRLSKKLLQIALSLCIIQIILAIISALIQFSLGALFSALLNTFLYLIVYYLAYLCVKYKNRTICCGCTPLFLYRLYLGLTIFILAIILILISIDISRGNYWRIINLIIITTLFSLNIAEIYYSKRLSIILNDQIHPEPPPSQSEAHHPHPPLY